MDRERLIEKREALQAKLEGADRLRRIGDLIQHLNKQGAEFEIHMECKKAQEALYAYPGNFTGLNWDAIPNSNKANYQSIAERNQIVSSTIIQYLDGSDTVFVTWGDGAKPILEISAKTAAKNAGAITDEDFDTWFLNPEKGFCLEHYHEGYVAWIIAS